MSKGNGNSLKKIQLVETFPNEPSRPELLRNKSQHYRFNATNEVTYNGLITALKNLNDKTLTELLEQLNECPVEQKIKICSSGKGTYNILHYAIQSSSAYMVEIILAKLPELINNKTNEGSNVLHLAVSRGNDDIIDLLLKQDLKFLEQKNNFDENPLQTALNKSYKSSAKCIIKFLNNESLETKLKQLGVDIGNEIVAGTIEELKLSNKFFSKFPSPTKDIQSKTDYNDEDIIKRILIGELKFRVYKNSYIEENIVEVLNLEHPIDKEKINGLVAKLVTDNMRLCIALHLGKDEWAGLTIQHIHDEEALRIVYNHPKGKSYKENKHVKDCIDNIDYPDQRITNLPAIISTENDNPDVTALAMINGFVNTVLSNFSSSRHQLYKSVTKTNQDFNDEREKHVIMLDGELVYGSNKMLAILRGSLEVINKQIKVLPELDMRSINPALINEAADMAVKENYVAIPVKTLQGGWACMILKNLPTGGLILIAQDPTGNPMFNDTVGWFNVLTLIQSKVQYLNMYDLRKPQLTQIEKDINDTGTITIDNIKNILNLSVLCGLPGSEFFNAIKDEKNINIPSLRKADAKVLIEHSIPVDNYLDTICAIPTADEAKISTDILGCAQFNEESHG